MIYPSLNLDARLYLNDANGKPSIASFTRASAATYVNALGKLASASSGALRHDYAPISGDYLGWLIEPAATNLAWYNCAPASFGGPTGLENVTVAAAADPFGTNLAMAVTENNVNGEHRLRLDGFGNSFTLNANTSYVLSAMVKAGPGTRGIKLSLGNASAAEIQINPATGAAQTRLISTGFTSISAPTVVQYPGGWWEVSAVALVAGSNLTSCNFVPALTSTATGWTSNYAGDSSSGNVLFGWGVVAGTARSSLILTPSSAAVTRAADVLTVPVSAFGYNQAEGTLLARFDAPATAVVPAVLYGSSGDFVAFDIQAPNLMRGVVAVGGPVVATMSASTFIANVQATAALAYKANDFALSVNGGAAITSASGAVPTTTALHIGAFNGNSILGGHIRHIAYFPRRLVNAELQDITR